MKKYLFFLFCLIASLTTSQLFAQADSIKIEAAQHKINADRKDAGRLDRKIDRRQKKMQHQERRLKRQEKKREKKLNHMNKQERKVDNIKSSSGFLFNLPLFDNRKRIALS